MQKQYFGYKTAKNLKVFLLCWVAYFSTYVGRLNFSAVLPEIQKAGGWTDTQIASVSTIFFIFYGMGQLINGIISDKANTRKMVFCGLFISALCNISLFMFPKYYVFLPIWALNGFVQSLVWTPVLKIGSTQFDEKIVNKFGVDMSTTVPIGTLLSYGLSLFTLWILPWRFVFLTCGLFEMAIAITWITATKPLLAGKVSVKAKTKEVKTVPPASIKVTLRAVAVSGVLLMMIPIIIQGTLKDSVTQWVPAFFSGQFGAKTTFSLALTMILPIVNVTGAYLANTVNKKFHSEIGTSALFFGIASVALFVLKFFGSNSIVLSLICMATVTNSMFAVNVMLITLVPLHFANIGRVSTISGAMDALAYVGCGALNLVTGHILDGDNGWANLFIMWIILGLSAIAFSLAIVPMWKKYLKNYKTKD